MLCNFGAINYNKWKTGKYKKSAGMEEISAIVQNCDKDGRVTDILFLTHDVTDQRERELQQEDALRLALASAEHANKAKTVGSLY